MFLKRILSVLLLLVWGAVFNSICTAAPLMVEKNLFATDRKPPSPESADTSSKTAKPGIAIGNFQLDGVIIQSNSKRAVLRMKNPPAGAAARKGQSASPFVTVREGQVVSDYRVSKIESKSISLEKDGQTFTICLFAENKVLTPPSPQPPATAPVQPQPAAPGVAPQEAAANQPPGVHNPHPNPNVAGHPASRRQAPPNVSEANPEPVINQDPNQAAETIEEEQ
ncbi:MAG: hypothetical protein ACLQVJ_16255 [Syntrophobacteraceae bacterium]